MKWNDVKDSLPEKTKLDKDSLVWKKPELLFWDREEGACVGWYCGSQFLVEDDHRLCSMLDVTHWQYITPSKEQTDA